MLQPSNFQSRRDDIVPLQSSAPHPTLSHGGPLGKVQEKLSGLQTGGMRFQLHTQNPRSRAAGENQGQNVSKLYP